MHKVVNCYIVHEWSHSRKPNTVQKSSQLQSMVANKYNGFWVCFSKFTGHIFDCDCNTQLSIAIQVINSDSLFQLPTCNHHFQLPTMIATFNHNSVFQRLTAIAALNCNYNSQPRFVFSASVIPTAAYNWNYLLESLDFFLTHVPW